MRHTDQELRKKAADHEARVDPVGTTVMARWQGAHATLRIDGDVDLNSADMIARAVRHLVDARVQSVAIDAGGVTFIDLAGCRSILRAGRALRATGATFRLSSVSKAVTQILALADLTTDRMTPPPGALAAAKGPRPALVRRADP